MGSEMCIRDRAEVALDEGHSRDLIATVAQELSSDLEDGP